MNTINIKLYNILKNDLKLSEAKAQEFVEAVSEVAQEDNKFKSSVKEDFLKMELKLELKIEQVKTDMVKWMFLFWVGSVVATLGGLIVIVKFMITK